MKIPFYEQIQGSIQNENVQTPQLSAPPASASPSSVYEAGARLGSAVADFGDKLAAHAIDWQKRENEKTLWDLDTKNGEEIDKTLNDPDKGLIASRSLSKASGITRDFNAYQAQKLKEIDEMDLPESVKTPLRQRTITRLDTAKSAIVDHEQKELETDRRNTFNANIASAVKMMSYAPTSKEFLAGREMAHATIVGELGKRGVDTSKDSAQVKQALSAFDEDALRAYVGANLDANPSAALAVLGQFKGVVDNEAYTKLVTYAKDKQFADGIFSAKSGGMTKDQIISKFVLPEKDPSTQAKRMEAVNRAFAHDNYEVINALRDKIPAGSLAKEEVDSAYRRGDITEGEANALREELRKFNSGEGSLSPALTLVKNDAKLKAQQLYGDETVDGVKNGTKKVALFMYQVDKVLRANPDPEVAKAKIQAMSKDVVVEKGWIKDTKKPQWLMDYSRQDLDEVARGIMKESVGAETFSALESWASKNNSPLTIDGMKKFLSEATPAQFPRNPNAPREAAIVPVGYVEPKEDIIDPTNLGELKPGRPVGDAIAWLNKNGQPVTPSNVKAYIELKKGDRK